MDTSRYEKKKKKKRIDSPKSKLRISRKPAV